MTESRWDRLVKAAEAKDLAAPIRTVDQTGRVQVTVHTPDGPITSADEDVNEAAGRVLDLL